MYMLSLFNTDYLYKYQFFFQDVITNMLVILHWWVSWQQTPLQTHLRQEIIIFGHGLYTFIIPNKFEGLQSSVSCHQ